MRLALPATLLLLLATASAGAKAALITEQLTVTGTGFSDVFGTNPAPVDPARLAFRISFDPSLDQFGQPSGISLLSSNLAIDAPLVFSYDHTLDELTVGGQGLSGVGISGLTNDVLVVIDGMRGAPKAVGFDYAAIGLDSVFAAATTTVQVPEPASLTLLAGFAALLGLRRRRP